MDQTSSADWGASVFGSAAIGEPLARSLRPQSRPQAGLGVRPVSRPSFADLIARSELGGTVGFVVRDVETGAEIANENGDLALPPASVTKAVTALYGLETLGPDYRFETKILALRSVVDGVLDGDLLLAGGGDPQLSTDDLISLRSALLEQGLREVKGRFLVWGGAIDRIAEIEPSQLDHLGYNPSVGGLNLNYNRVHFEWERQGTGYRVQMDTAAGLKFLWSKWQGWKLLIGQVPCSLMKMGDGVDQWSVARSALNNEGSRWLPVRYPALYTGDVFRALAANESLTLQDPVQIPDQFEWRSFLAANESPRRGLVAPDAR